MLSMQTVVNWMRKPIWYPSPTPPLPPSPRRPGDLARGGGQDLAVLAVAFFPTVSYVLVVLFPTVSYVPVLVAAMSL